MHCEHLYHISYRAAACDIILLGANVMDISCMSVPAACCVMYANYNGGISLLFELSLSAVAERLAMVQLDWRSL